MKSNSPRTWRLRVEKSHFYPPRLRSCRALCSAVRFFFMQSSLQKMRFPTASPDSFTNSGGYFVSLATTQSSAAISFPQLRHFMKDSSRSERWLNIEMPRLWNQPRELVSALIFPWFFAFALIVSASAHRRLASPQAIRQEPAFSGSGMQIYLWFGQCEASSLDGYN